MAPDEDKLDALVTVLGGIAEVAEQEHRPTTPRATDAGHQAGGGATTGTDLHARASRLDVAVLEILAASSFDEQVALRRLVADAFRD
jgi:hypothetical protein